MKMASKFSLKILKIVANTIPIDKIVPFNAYGEKISNIKVFGISGLVKFSFVE
jgi:hypothetical protein